MCVTYDRTPLVKDLVEPADGVGASRLWSRLQPGCVSAVVGGQIEHFSGLLFSRRVEPRVGGGGGGGERRAAVEGTVPEAHQHDFVYRQ